MLIFIFIAFNGFISVSQQTIEEAEYAVFIGKIDSLREKKQYLEAYELYYEYSNTLYLHNHYASKNRSTQLIEIRDNLTKSIQSHVSKADKVNYYREKADRFIEYANYKRALYAVVVLSRIDSNLNVEREIHDLKLKLPTDTVKSYDGHTPQLLWEGGNPSKTTECYLYRDSSLFSGVIIRKHQTASGHHSTLLKYEHYIDGLLSHTRTEYYLPTNRYHRNKVFEYQDSSRFWLASTSTYHTIDGTSSAIIFYQTGAIKQLNRGHSTRNSSYELSIAFDPSGDTISYAETTHQYSDTTDISYTLNQYGDTIGKSLNYAHENDFFTYDFTLGNNGDTISRYKTVNGKMDGLEISQFFDEADSAYYKRIIWDKGKIINIEIENAIFIGEKDKVVDKAQFIDYVNSKEYPEVYIESTVGLPSSINKTGDQFLVSTHGGYYRDNQKIFKQKLKLDKKSR